MNEPKLPWIKMILWYPFSLVLAGAGLFFFILPPVFFIGIFLWLLAAAPYVHWLSKKIREDLTYANRDHSLTEDEPKPWEENVLEVSDDELIEIITRTRGERNG